MGINCTFFDVFCTISSRLGFRHKIGAMPPKQTDESSPERERHNLHMTPELKARLADARNKSGNSMNGEIHSRLEATFDDSAQRIAAVILPLLQKLDEDDQAKFADLIAAMAR
ncbi:hypothetical protein NKJ73_23495 [Mesorhizobium sp. M0074]|uniref:hypothetical protein n=2 Tax=Mesorhizobium TaxID=68287 RepID=UPI0033389504